MCIFQLCAYEKTVTHVWLGHWLNNGSCSTLRFQERRQKRGRQKDQITLRDADHESSPLCSVSSSLNVCMAGDERACWTRRIGWLLMERQQKKPSVLLSPPPPLPPCILYPFIPIYLILSLCLSFTWYSSLPSLFSSISLSFSFLPLSPPPPAPCSTRLFPFIPSGRAERCVEIGSVTVS